LSAGNSIIWGTKERGSNLRISLLEKCQSVSFTLKHNTGQFENAVMIFVEACSVHGEWERGIEILQKIPKIIPYSDEIKNLMSNLNAN
jgi:hypothetical protein